MTRISSNLGSWSTQVYEMIRGPSPISFFNRVCFLDQRNPLDRTWRLETSKYELLEKIQVCKDKAGIRGPKYPPALENWKKEVIGLAEGTHSGNNQLPSKASSKNEFAYNHEIAKAETDKALDTLSQNVSSYLTLLLIHPWPKSKAAQDIDSGELFTLIAEKGKDPQKDIFSMYLDLFSKKMGWGFAKRMGLRFAYRSSSLLLSGITQTTFQSILAEIRYSTEGRVEPIFEGLLDHLEKFLKDYRGEKKLEDFTENKGLPQLCKELSPFLVKEFFPKRIAFFKVVFKKIPLMSLPCYLLDATVGAVLTVILRQIVKWYLPTGLQALSENLEASVVEKLTEKEGANEAPVNYQLAIPILRLINEKLFGFATMLKEPPADIEEPPPPRIAAKLESVIDELMKLSKNPSNDERVVEGLRSGLIDGGYHLMKYWQTEQESLLNQVLVLASLPFAESQEVSDHEADRKELKALWKKQGEIVETVSNRVFELEIKKTAAGTPSSLVMSHLSKEHEKIKRYLGEGLSDIIGLRSSLKKAKEELKKPDYKGFDLVLGKHLIFWEGFLSLMRSATKKYYPKPASEILVKEFFPLCKEATKQIDRISELQDEWILYTRHKELKQRFSEMFLLFDVKRVQDLNLSHIQKVLNKIETLLPPNPLEVQVLKRFVESYSTIKETETLLKDLLVIRNSLKKQKQGNLNQNNIEEVKVFLAKYPEFRKDKEFASIYKRYSSLGQGEVDIEGLTKETILQEIAKRIEQEVQEQTQILKDLQLNLLHRIDPTRPVSSFAVPIPSNTLLKELNLWIQKRRQGYETLEKANLQQLQEGSQDLEQHAGLLERKIQKMNPHTLYFPLETVIDGAAYIFGDITNVPYVRSVKQHLIQDLNGILAGVTPLITAKKEEGKRNLYSWIERLALYETLQYFKSKASG